MEHIYENVGQVKKRAAKLFKGNGDASKKNAQEFQLCQCPPISADSKHKKRHLPDTPVNAEHSQCSVNRNTLNVLTPSMLPAGTLVQCRSCDLVHLCVPARRRSISPNDSPEELRTGGSGATVERGPTPTPMGDHEGPDPAGGGPAAANAAQPSTEDRVIFPPGAEHAQCRQLGGQLKRKITILTNNKMTLQEGSKSLSNENKLLMAQKKTMQKELEKAKKDLHAWTLNASALNVSTTDHDAKAEQLEQANLKLQGEIGLLQQQLRTARSGCHLPQHDGPFCTVGAHQDREKNRGPECNVPEHGELSDKLAAVNGDLKAAKDDADKEAEESREALKFASEQLEEAIEAKRRAEESYNAEKEVAAGSAGQLDDIKPGKGQRRAPSLRRGPTIATPRERQPGPRRLLVCPDFNQVDPQRPNRGPRRRRFLPGATPPLEYYS